jgi:hypothetical protein
MNANTANFIIYLFGMTIKLFFILLISFSVFGRCYGLNIEEEVSMMVSKIQYSLLFGTPE